MKTETVVENGFKESEIGLIPSDWETVKLGDITKISSGGSAPQGDKYFNGKNPFIRVQHIEREGDRVIKWDLITDDAVKKYKLKIYPKGTIVFPKSGASIYLEKRAMLPLDAYIVSHLCAVISNDKNVNQKFLFYKLRNIELSKDKADGYPTLNLSEVKNVKVIIPSLLEQQKIAFVLSKIQQAIEQQDRIIETTRELKKSLMNKLFTEGLHGEEQKETEIGLMPKSWRIVKLGDNDIVEVIMGQSPPSSTYNTMKEGIPFFQGKAEFGDIYPKAKKYCSKPNRIANEGDILLSVRAPVGDVNLSPFICCIGRGLAAIRCKDKLNNYFLFNYLLQSKNKIASLGDGSTFKAIGKTVVKNIRFPLPERKEQDEITNIFSNTDKKILQAESKKQTLQALFRTMLNQLMRGKIRVKDLDIEVN